MVRKPSAPATVLLIGLAIDLASCGGSSPAGVSGGSGGAPKPLPHPAATYSEKILYSFTGGADGAGPASGVIFDSVGNLYGTTQLSGTVFKLTPPGVTGASWTESVLANVPGAVFYGPPEGVLMERGGNLYGTSRTGGSVPCFPHSGVVSNCGSIFALSPPGSGSGPGTETVLYNFNGVSDGSFPNGALIFDTAGNLYGTTESGGANQGGGVAFELSPPSGGIGSWTERVLYNFNATDGTSGSKGLVFDSQGNLYGTTLQGGTGLHGTVFKLSPPPGGSGLWTETVLYTFKGSTDGNFPNGGLIFDDAGNLYGTTQFGGKTCGQATCGVVFELSPPTNGTGSWTERVLYSFTGGSDGYYPTAGLIFDSGGNLYGTAFDGGNPSVSCAAGTGCGVVFRLSPSSAGGWTETVLYTFAGGSDGGAPSGGLIFDSNGNLYGTTTVGGNHQGLSPLGNGVVFELIPSS